MYVASVIILAFLTKGWMLYGLPFLEYLPVYEIYANGKWIPCDKNCVKNQICGKGLEYET